MYDLIIIGGSAAASTAGIYATRRRLNFKIITKEFGGEVATSGEIGNWPGQIHADGIKLAREFKDHLKSYGVEPEEGVWVQKVAKTKEDNFCITTMKDGQPAMAADKLDGMDEAALKCDYEAKAVIIATGVHPRMLDVPGEKEYRNKGVSYCTTCDGPLFPGKVVATIGGGNGALESAIMLAGIASKVYLINKNPKFKGDDILVEKIQSLPNVEVIKELPIDGAFIHIGNTPNSDIAPDNVEKNMFGNIIVNGRCETNIPGLYAAGDVTDVAFKQIVIAAGQGCIATLSAVEYLDRRS
ncbi:MAG: Pyridine nucleotide-disulfide oxidoreductase, FAD/NAD(P)-binding domain-containing protein [Parcubacteria group bacterium GW2011_GWA1_49_11]|nr:MAG: Pyridine nucleotide-disulfide oxidoreductase, FAD/NAD(P)-binding domain-containing protein [Parcubacteria group bacterium GW2011_GWA1_49_11]